MVVRVAYLILVTTLKTFFKGPVSTKRYPEHINRSRSYKYKFLKESCLLRIKYHVSNLLIFVYLMLVLEIIIITPDNSQVLDQRWHVHFCWTKVDK